MKITYTSDRKVCMLLLYLQYPMRLCRWAGFFPVEALNQAAIEKLRFNLWSSYAFYYAATIIGQVIFTGFSLFQLLSRQLTLATFSSFVFYGTAMGSTLLFLDLARNYADFLRKVLQLEQCLYGVWTTKTTVKSNAVILTVTGLAIVENALSVVFVMNLVMDCVGDFTLSGIVFETYFKFRMPYIYDHVTYATWKAVFLEVANLQATFLWSFMDVFIMTFSIYLTSYCNDLRDQIIIYIKNAKGIDSWECLRNRYCHLMALVKLVDAAINRFVLLAFFIDVYFICLQLFNTLNQGYSGFHSCGQKGLDAALNGVAHSVYYSFSFLFLILRAMIMSLLASNVHTAARKPIFALRNIASSVYNVEVHRILHQMTYKNLALTGFFFRVTRNMIFKVAAAIVTYEIVLLQFGKGHGKHSSKHDDSAN